MSSSDEDLDDSKIKEILQAVDKDFLSNEFYQKSQNGQDQEENSVSNPPDFENIITINGISNTTKKTLPSQRYLQDEEYFDSDRVKIPETMQRFVAKKLSNMIENQFEFAELKYPKIKKFKSINRIKLLKGCDECINLEDNSRVKIYAQKKPLIKKKLDPDDNLLDYEKIKLAAIEPQCIINKSDMKYWNDRKKSKIYHYKSKSGPPFQFVEPDNEFSTLRRKNNWSFKKISRQ